MPINTIEPQPLIIELCDQNGNPVNVFNPFDFNFLLKSNNGETLLQIYGEQSYLQYHDNQI